MDKTWQIASRQLSTPRNVTQIPLIARQEAGNINSETDPSEDKFLRGDFHPHQSVSSTQQIIYYYLRPIIKMGLFDNEKWAPRSMWISDQSFIF